MIMSKEKISERMLEQEMQDIAKRLNLKDIGEALYFPKYFQIETSRICNARCPYCAYDQWDKSVPFMSDDLFRKVADELSSYSDWIEWVCLSRAGEPLLDKKITGRVRILKQGGIKRVNISTNAALLDEKRARELLEAGLDEIMFSIDAIEKEAYEEIKVGLDFEKTINNIETFFKLREEIKPDTIVRVRAVSFLDIENGEHRAKLDRWEKFWQRFKKSHDRIYMKKAHNWGNQKDLGNFSSQNDQVFHPCILPWSTLHISSNGIITLCPMDYDARMNLGNINSETIAEVWRSSNCEHIRKLHSNGNRNEISFCKGCLLFDQEFTLENKEP
jgi:radical SAM protein with 4Fe4S-binding SPASM domain